MTLLNSMTRDLGITQRVPVGEVRLNNLNFYDYQESVIDSLVDSIEKNGQMENAIAYKSDVDSSGDLDGCKYTLLGGHTRYLAISKLLESGQGDGYINISIVDKPNNENMELALIMSNNVQRKKSPEVRYNEIMQWSKIYDELETRPTGTKRDWIGSKIGMSGRGVDKVIDRFESTSSTSTTEQREFTRNDIIKRLKTNVKSLNRTIELLDQGNSVDLQEDIVHIRDLLVEIIY